MVIVRRQTKNVKRLEKFYISQANKPNIPTPPLDNSGNLRYGSALTCRPSQRTEGEGGAVEVSGDDKQEYRYQGDEWLSS